MYEKKTNTKYSPRIMVENPTPEKNKISSTKKFTNVLSVTSIHFPPLPIKIGAESDPEWNNYIETIQQFAMQP